MNYNFKYASNDAGKHSRSESNVDGVVKGSYSYIDPNGHMRKVIVYFDFLFVNHILFKFFLKVNYIADKNGFRVEGDIGVDRVTAEAAARLSENMPEQNYKHSGMNKMVTSSLYSQYQPSTRQTPYFDYSPHYTSTQFDDLMGSPQPFYQSRLYKWSNKPLSLVQALHTNLFPRSSLNSNSDMFPNARQNGAYQKTIDNRPSMDSNSVSNKKEDYTFHYDSQLSRNDQIDNQQFHRSPVFDFQQFKNYEHKYKTRSHQVSKQKDQNVLSNKSFYKDEFTPSPNGLVASNEAAKAYYYDNYEEQRRPRLDELDNLGSLTARLKKGQTHTSYFVTSPTHEIQFWS